MAKILSNQIAPGEPVTVCRASQKSPLLLVLTFSIWAATLVLLGRHLIPVIQSAHGLSEHFVLLSFSSLLVIFWLLGSYYLGLVGIFVWQKIRPSAVGEHSKLQRANEPPVAILYPTCDDFQREAVMTCLAQDYSEFHVFLLDDSRNESCRRMVDDFNKEFPDRTTVVRRSDRKGFKAGNLNHALRGAARNYPFFAVMDADERIPTNFLREMMTRIADGNHAFAQANHAPNPNQCGIFPQAMGQTILPFWSMLLAHKQRYGFVPCVGHGLLIRQKAWEEVGGFPEVASEDIAFSSVLLERGLRGAFAEEVVCYEDFPDSITSFKKQQQRYAAGVLEAVCGYWPRLLRSHRATWIEKFDFALCCLPLYVPILGLLFMLTVGLGFPLCFGKFSTIVADTKFGHFTLPYFQTVDGRFQSLWGSIFVYLSIFFSLSPSFPMLVLAFCGKIKRPVRLLFVSNLVYMSTMFVTCYSLVRVALRRSVQFLPTGSLSKSRAEKGRTGLVVQPIVYEGALSLILGLLLLGTLNLGLGAVAVAPLLSHCRRITFVACIAFCGVAAQVVLAAVSSSAPWGIPSLVFSIHF